MIKKVTVQQLAIGMYIHDLNAGWMTHSFWRNQFMLKSEADLKKLLESGITDVYIDTEKGLDVKDAPTQAEVDEQVLTQLVVKTQRTFKPMPTKATQQEEVKVAKRIQMEATTVMHDLLMDVRMGKQIEIEKADPVVEKITDSIFRNQGTIVSLCRIKERDNYTFQHCVSVSTLLIAFCHALGFDRETIHEAGMGGLMHDIGKMRVPDEILNKPGRLTEDEFEIMKAHVEYGTLILEKTPGISETVAQIAGEHHERVEGSGYPKKLQASQISQLGKMAAIVDVYDAITSNRVYHRGMEPMDALKKMFEWSNHHFDEELVQHFIQAIGIYPVGSLVRLESGRLGVIVDQSEAGLLFPIVRVFYDASRGRPIPPKDVNLGHTTGADSEDRIMNYEMPEAWGVNPYDYL